MGVTCCDAGVPRVTQGHIDRLKAGEWGFEDLLKERKAGARVQGSRSLGAYEKWRSGAV